MAERTESDDLLIKSGKATLWCVGIVGVAWSSASAMQALWNWFLAPAGLMRISLPIAWGICVFHTFLVIRGMPFGKEAQKKSWGDYMGEILARTLACWISYGFGWVIHQYWMTGQ